MQITRIKQIKDYRIFQNWRQRGNTDFARFNVIYGGNGSGKSTLAALLTEVAKGDWSDGTILTVKDDSQQTREIRKPDEALSVRLCIFNADYVAKNLKFDKGETESLLYLGEESIDIQNQREVLEDAINDSETALPELEQELTRKQKHRDRWSAQDSRFAPRNRRPAIRRKTFPAPSIRISITVTSTRYVELRHRSANQANRIAP